MTNHAAGAFDAADDDDAMIGRVLHRREALRVLGTAGLTLASLTACGSAPATLALSRKPAGSAAGGATVAAATTSPSATAVDCVVTPQQTVGPYFVEENLRRDDIRRDTSTGAISDGTPVLLALRLIDLTSCGGRPVPITGAQVHTWQANAQGIYSDIAAENTVGSNYLRGFQVTDRSGEVRFKTILPGWYHGRAVHHHFKVRTTGTDGAAYEFTTQLYYPEEFTAGYLATGVYAAHGQPDTVNSTDNIFKHENGDQLVLSPVALGGTAGYRASFTIGLNLADATVGAPDVFVPPQSPSASPSASA